MARPSKIEDLTDEQKKMAVAIVRGGGFQKDACEVLGIEPETLARWRKLAKEGDERYVAFISDLELAFSTCKVELVTTLKKIGVAGDTRALMWLLERLYPKDFAPLQKQEHSGPGGAPLGAAGPVMILPAKEVEEFEAPPPPAPSEQTDDNA
jgi:hypothetical protein